MATYKYRALGKVVELEPDPDLVAVRFKEPAPRSVRLSIANEAGVSRFPERTEIPGEKYTILPVSAAPVARATRLASAMRSLDAKAEVERVAPVFKVGDRHVIATDRVLVGFKTGSAKEHLRQIKKVGATIVSKGDPDSLEYLVRLSPSDDPFEICAALSKVKSVDYAEPDFVTIGRHMARRPPPASSADAAKTAAVNADPLVAKQYALKLTQAIEAWNVQRGRPEVRIAILDEGVDSRHEDLKAAIVGSYDATDDDEFQEPNTWDNHGTCCAGLAAAVPNNARGIAGIAAGCSLLAARIAFSDHDGATWTTTNEYIRRAIDWSWRNKAWVLSNSWGGGAPSSAIANAFARARTKGRGGKGCVVVIAAGNEAGAVSFPATLKDTIAVSASNEFDEFKSKTSKDGENWWGSNYGPEITLAAPGVHNYTTDISGKGEPGLINYRSDFNGTSAATPIVAGAAALVLSANPSLSEKQVRDILIGSADKVGPYPYAQGRNDQFGSGRVNILKAVRAAKPRAPVDVTPRPSSPFELASPESQLRPARRTQPSAFAVAQPSAPKWARVPQESAERDPFAYVCFITPAGQSAQSGGVRGTGFLAFPNLVVTAAHVVGDVALSQGTPNASLDVVFGADWYSSRQAVRSISPALTHPKWNGKAGSPFDVAVFKIDGPFGSADFVLAPFAMQDPAQLGQKQIYLAGFPNSLPDDFIYSTGRLRTPTHGLVWHDATAAEGDSGAPLIMTVAPGRYRAVGLHTYDKGLGGNFKFFGGLYFTGEINEWISQIGSDMALVA